MSFYEEEDWKFYLYLGLAISALFLVAITVNSLIISPAERCEAFCEGRNDKLSGYYNRIPIECICTKDTQKLIDDRLKNQR